MRVGSAIALAGALGAAPLRAQLAPACERCHSSLEFLSRAARRAVAGESLVVIRGSLTRDRHVQVACASCHVRATTFPHELGSARVVTCLPCHIAQDTLWRGSVHAPLWSGAVRASCADCHGAHRPATAGFLHTADGRAAMRAACVRCHPTEVQSATVGVHADSVACTACHGEHALRPVPDPATRNIDIDLARACGRCHADVARTWWLDMHGHTAAAQANASVPIAADTAPTCVSCHGEHGIRRHDDPEWRRDVAEACTRCHAAYGTTYRDGYHGQATRVGSRAAAMCADCHTAHHVLPDSVAASSVSAENRLATCRRCHTEARPRFLGYRPHANVRDRQANPPLFWVWLFMNVALFGTIAVWGTHALAWFFRNFRERRRRAHAAAAGLAPMDSALRGGPPYVWRFNAVFRIVHALIVLTFFTLVITGLPLRFSCTQWAPDLMRVLGGAERAGVLHRSAGVLMFGYVVLYAVYMAVRLWREKNRIAFLAGTDSILFRYQDLRDIVAMLKYFAGRGAHPRFGRYNYMEKFDYFAEAWGVGAIGFTGLMLWFPEFFSRWFPGILFNVAIIIHSYEAMIATAFIFTIHFFNVHLRPEKWPLDAVMFTGRASLAYIEEEHPLVAERIAPTVRAGPPSERAVADRPAPPPPAWLNWLGAFAGLIMLGVGLLLIGLILWGTLC